MDFMVNDLDILVNNMFCNLGCMVDKFQIMPESMQCFHAIIVLKIPIHGGLTVMTFPSHRRRIFLLQDGFSDNHCFVGDGGPHIMECAGMR